MSSSRRQLMSLLLALAATLVVGYFVLQQLTWRDLVALWQGSDVRFVALGFALYCCATLLRAARYRALTGDRISTVLFLRTVVVQNLLNTFLPLRAGEASYVYMVHRTGTVAPGENVGSLLAARVLDLLAALSIPAAILPLSSAAELRGLPVGWLAVLPLLGAAALFLAVRKAEALAELVGRLANGRRAWLNRGLSFLRDALRSFARLRGARLLGRVTLLTSSCWILMYLSGYCALVGVGLRLPFFDCIFGYSFPLVASMMPFYMLGGFGVFEGSVGVGLNLVGVPMSQAMAVGFALHLVELLYILLPAPLGLLPVGAPAASAD